MNEGAAHEDEILSTSTLRGILLLGGVASVAYLAYEFWYKQRAVERALPKKPRVIRIPIELPIQNTKKK